MPSFISYDGYAKFLDALAGEYDVLVPIKRDGQRFFRRYHGQSADLVVGEVRASDPLKTFFFRPREQVAEGFESVQPSGGKPLCIVGAKACDLKGFKTQDFVFLGSDGEDPFYAKARKENLVIAADCTCAIDTCFCLALDVTPYPLGDFDLSLSALDEGYVVEVGSDKGQALLANHAALFREATADLITKRDRVRAEVTRRVEENIAENGIPKQEELEGAVQRNYDAPLWADEAGRCVECGACNTICPTCHCFFLCDQKDEDRMARFRLWDSCLLKDFARVAGGANPRSQLWMRLRNRFEKKFDYFPKVAGIYACTGCGRCVSACPAKIDIRSVMKRLVTDA